MMPIRRWPTFAGPVLALLLAGCSTGPAVDYGPVRQDLRTSLQATLAAGGTSASYAVMQDGRLLLADAVGSLDGAGGGPVGTGILYGIGSVSKVVTAAAVMKLVDQGRLGLDDPVVRHLPEFAMADQRFQDITVRMLLDHSSGMPGTDYPSGISYGGYDSDFPRKALAYFGRSALKADPGKFSVYCNDGFEVAELLVAKAGGLPFAQYVQHNLFGPLGLDSAGYATRAWVPGTFAVKGRLPQEFPNVMGSGGISTTLADLARFGELFLGRSAGVLSPASLRELCLRQGRTFLPTDTYAPLFGLGWDAVGPVFSDYDFGPAVLAKSGGTSQFSAQLYVVPRYRLVACMSATDDFAGDVPTTLRQVIAKVLAAQGVSTAKAAVQPTPAVAQPLPDGFAAACAGLYGSNSNLVKVVVNGDQTLTVQRHDGSAFVTVDDSLAYDGQVFVRASGEKAYRFTQAEGMTFLMSISEAEAVVFVRAQRLAAGTVPLGAWSARLDQLYLPSQVSADAAYVLQGLRLRRPDGTPDGVLLVQTGTAFMPLVVLDDDHTSMALQAPGLAGRDLDTLTAARVDGEERLAYAAYELRPAGALADLAAGPVVIPDSGANALYRIPAAGFGFDLPAGGRVIAYDTDGAKVYDTRTQGLGLAQVPASGYLRFAGAPGTRFTVSL